MLSRILIITVCFTLCSNAENEKKSAALVTFFSREGIHELETDLVANKVFDELLKNKKLEMKPLLETEAVLKDNGLSRQNLYTDHNLLTMCGKLLETDLIIAGTAGRINNMYQVELKFYDVQAETVLSETVDEFPDLQNRSMKGPVKRLIKDSEIFGKKNEGSKKHLFIWGGAGVLTAAAGVTVWLMLKEDEEDDRLPLPPFPERNPVE